MSQKPLGVVGLLVSAECEGFVDYAIRLEEGCSLERVMKVWGLWFFVGWDWG